LAKSAAKKEPKRLPLLAVRDVVVFPQMAVPLSVGRERSIKALEAAMREHKLIAVVSQKKASTQEPSEKDFYRIGTLAEVAQYMRMPDGTLKIFLNGRKRIAIKKPQIITGGYWECDVGYIETPRGTKKRVEALSRQVLTSYEQFLKITRRQPPESLTQLKAINDPGHLADSIASAAIAKIEERQEILEVFNVQERLEKLTEMLGAELEILGLERKIHTRVRGQIQKTQKEYYLSEQMKAIQKELRQKDDFGKEVADTRKKIKACKMPAVAEEAALKELSRLEKMMPYSPEATVCRGYLDWMVQLPWSVSTKDKLDIKHAREVLDADHYGLAKSKERVLEYLAVCKLTKKLRGPILCFAGPPGVGKTSLGKSIARAMNRNFVRISLGGVRDEAEIRGHRRTYIGSLPGRIIQSLKKAKSHNPVFLLDEIDKLGSDWRGDPTSALLEVLDPEQNSTFMDHYLDVEFDLSKVMFICTANNLDMIPATLRDRLEIIRFSGYTHNEKKRIAQEYLIPKQGKMNGLKKGQLEIDGAALDRVLQEYTRESGVRSVEREVASICRKSARIIVEEKVKKVEVGANNLEKFLGVPKYLPEEKSYNEVGVATGLAWTEVGGTILSIEVLQYPGKGEIQITGQLGNVMIESAKAALSYIKSVSKALGVNDSVFKKNNFHIHVPEGAIPKDGPSAGIALATALASLVTGKPVTPALGMTGEITLRGRVLAIGGLKEKVIAAHRSGLTKVLFPEQNKKDLEDIPTEVREAVTLVPVAHIEDVFKHALPIKKSTAKKGRKSSSWSPRPATRRPAHGIRPPLA
jgi:ATP-dependent Lon protease